MCFWYKRALESTDKWPFEQKLSLLTGAHGLSGEHWVIAGGRVGVIQKTSIVQNSKVDEGHARESWNYAKQGI